MIYQSGNENDAQQHQKGRSYAYIEQTGNNNQSTQKQTEGPIQGGIAYNLRNYASTTQTGSDNFSNEDQEGLNNISEVEQKGDRNTADVFQTQESLTAAAYPNSGNSSSIDQIGNDNNAEVEQYGRNNESNILQDGDYNTATVTQQSAYAGNPNFGNHSSIDQNGDANDAIVEQRGRNNESDILQNGNDNTASVKQSGSSLNYGRTILATLNRTAAAISLMYTSMVLNIPVIFSSKVLIMKHSSDQDGTGHESIILQYDSYNFATASQTGTVIFLTLLRTVEQLRIRYSDKLTLTSGGGGFLELPAASLLLEARR